MWDSPLFPGLMMLFVSLHRLFIPRYLHLLQEKVSCVVIPCTIPVSYHRIVRRDVAVHSPANPRQTPGCDTGRCHACNPDSLHVYRLIPPRVPRRRRIRWCAILLRYPRAPETVERDPTPLLIAPSRTGNACSRSRSPQGSL